MSRLRLLVGQVAVLEELTELSTRKDLSLDKQIFIFCALFDIAVQRNLVSWDDTTRNSYNALVNHEILTSEGLPQHLRSRASQFPHVREQIAQLSSPNVVKKIITRYKMFFATLRITHYKKLLDYIAHVEKTMKALSQAQKDLLTTEKDRAISGYASFLEEVVRAEINPKLSVKQLVTLVHEHLACLSEVGICNPINPLQLASAFFEDKQHNTLLTKARFLWKLSKVVPDTYKPQVQSELRRIRRAHLNHLFTEFTEAFSEEEFPEDKVFVLLPYLKKARRFAEAWNMDIPFTKVDLSRLDLSNVNLSRVKLNQCRINGITYLPSSITPEQCIHIENLEALTDKKLQQQTIAARCKAYAPVIHATFKDYIPEIEKLVSAFNAYPLLLAKDVVESTKKIPLETAFLILTDSSLNSLPPDHPHSLQHIAEIKGPADSVFKNFLYYTKHYNRFHPDEIHRTLQRIAKECDVTKLNGSRVNKSDTLYRLAIEHIDMTVSDIKGHLRVLTDLDDANSQTVQSLLKQVEQLKAESRRLKKEKVADFNKNMKLHIEHLQSQINQTAKPFELIEGALEFIRGSSWRIDLTKVPHLEQEECRSQLHKLNMQFAHLKLTKAQFDALSSKQREQYIQDFNSIIIDENLTSQQKIDQLEAFLQKRGLHILSASSENAPLKIACLVGDTDVVNWLLAHDVPVNAPLLDALAFCGDLSQSSEVITLLRKSAPQQFQIHHLIAFGYTDEAKARLQQINSLAGLHAGANLLWWAVHARSTALIPDIVDREKSLLSAETYSPFELAVQQNAMPYVRLLLAQAPIDKLLPIPRQKILIASLVQADRGVMATELIQREAHYEIQDLIALGLTDYIKKELTAGTITKDNAPLCLATAARYNQKTAFQLLQGRFKLPLHVPFDSQGNTYLHAAARNGCAKMMDFIFQQIPTEQRQAALIGYNQDYISPLSLICEHPKHTHAIIQWMKLYPHLSAFPSAPSSVTLFQLKDTAQRGRSFSLVAKTRPLPPDAIIQLVHELEDARRKPGRSKHVIGIQIEITDPVRQVRGAIQDAKPMFAYEQQQQEHSLTYRLTAYVTKNMYERLCALYQSALCPEPLLRVAVRTHNAALVGFLTKRVPQGGDTINQLYNGETVLAAAQDSGAPENIIAHLRQKGALLKPKKRHYHSLSLSVQRPRRGSLNPERSSSPLSIDRPRRGSLSPDKSSPPEEITIRRVRSGRALGFRPRFSTASGGFFRLPQLTGSQPQSPRAKRTLFGTPMTPRSTQPEQ